MLFLAEPSDSRSKNFCRPKLKVKMNFKTVRTRLLPILKYLEAGNYPAKIARMLGFSKPQVAYYVRKLEQVGFVRRQRRSNMNACEALVQPESLKYSDQIAEQQKTSTIDIW